MHSSFSIGTKLKNNYLNDISCRFLSKAKVYTHLTITSAQIYAKNNNKKNKCAQFE